MTVMEDIRDSIDGRMAAILPAEFRALDYVELVEDNNWNQIPKGYGTRAKLANEVNGVNRVYTIEQIYEIMLTDQYIQVQTSDENMRDVMFDLRGKCLDLYKDFVNTKAGLPAQVIQINKMLISEPEIDEESKVVIQRMEFSVFYRVTL